MVEATVALLKGRADGRAFLSALVEFAEKQSRVLAEAREMLAGSGRSRYELLDLRAALVLDHRLPKLADLLERSRALDDRVREVAGRVLRERFSEVDMGELRRMLTEEAILSPPSARPSAPLVSPSSPATVARPEPRVPASLVELPREEPSPRATSPEAEETRKPGAEPMFSPPAVASVPLGRRYVARLRIAPPRPQAPVAGMAPQEIFRLLGEELRNAPDEQTRGLLLLGRTVAMYLHDPMEDVNPVKGLVAEYAYVALSGRPSPTPRAVDALRALQRHIERGLGEADGEVAELLRDVRDVLELALSNVSNVKEADGGGERAQARIDAVEVREAFSRRLREVVEGWHMRHGS